MGKTALDHKVNTPVSEGCFRVPWYRVNCRTPPLLGANEHGHDTTHIAYTLDYPMWSRPLPEGRPAS